MTYILGEDTPAKHGRRVQPVRARLQPCRKESPHAEEALASEVALCKPGPHWSL